MSYLLHIEASPSQHSVSSSITSDFISAWRLAHPQEMVVHRDITGVPHLDMEAIYAVRTPSDQLSESMAGKLAFRKELISEIIRAEEIVVSVPMWNWSFPSSLKAYIDQIVMSGTLDARENRKLEGKKVTFVVAHGSSYKEGAPKHGWDFQTGYLKFIAGVLGSTDVEIITAEFTLAGIAPGMEHLVEAKEASIELARQVARNRAA